MKTNTLKIVLSVFLLAGLITACKKDKSDSANTARFVYHENVIELGKPTLKGMIELDDDFFKLAESTPRIDDIHEGSVVVSGVTDETPTGLARKILSIKSEGPNRKFITDPASLEDIYEELDVDYTMEIPSSARKMENARTSEDPSFFSGWLSFLPNDSIYLLAILKF